MDQTVRLTMTPEEYLAWECRQEGKNEFDGLSPIPMNGGTAAHAIIERNILHALIPRLRGSPCQVFGSTLKVRIGNRFRYPDGCITCTPIARDSLAIEAPVVLFEIISDSSERTDRKVKLAEYISILSLQRYILLEQDEFLATVVARTATGWSIEMLGIEDSIVMPELAIELPLAALYEGVTLPEPPAE